MIYKATLIYEYRHKLQRRFVTVDDAFSSSTPHAAAINRFCILESNGSAGRYYKLEHMLLLVSTYDIRKVIIHRRLASRWWATRCAFRQKFFSHSNVERFIILFFALTKTNSLIPCHYSNGNKHTVGWLNADNLLVENTYHFQFPPSIKCK